MGSLPFIRFNLSCGLFQDGLLEHGDLMEAISLKEFLEISDEAVSKIVSSQGQQTCIFPFNGTRRWFLFEHADSNVEMSMDSYNDLTGKRYIEMFKMLFMVVVKLSNSIGFRIIL